MKDRIKNIDITVLMSVYNEREEYLKKSIRSILDQTFGNFEFLIINDGSTGEFCLKTLDEFSRKDPRIKIIHNPKNIGLTKSLNIGLSWAKGRYVARMDSDDFSDPKRLERQLKFMQENPDCALCGTWAVIIDKNDRIIGRKKGYSQYPEIKKSIIYINNFTHSSWFFRKTVILSIGGYSENLQKSQDYDLLLKLIPRHKVVNIPEFLTYYRFRDDSISFKNNKSQEKYSISLRFKALREYGYPKIYYLKTIIPAIRYLLMPSFLKKFLMKILWKI